MLVPKEMKVEQTGGIKAMSDEQLDAAIGALQDLLARRAAAAAGQLPEPEGHRGFCYPRVTPSGCGRRRAVGNTGQFSRRPVMVKHNSLARRSLAAG